MNPINTAVTAILNQSVSLAAMAKIITEHQDRYNEILSVLRGPGLSNYHGRVVVTGVGKNANIATKASETMASLGIPSLYLNTGHYSHGDAGFISPDDVLIHISRSGKTEEMLGVAMHLRTIRPSVPQILLHCNPDLTEKQLSLFDYDFCTGKAVEVDECALAPTMSTTLLLALIDTFAINLSSERGFTPADFLGFHPGGSLGQMLRGE
jgi:D-arabinose 5-phosphate isomerase GutQ